MPGSNAEEEFESQVKGASLPLPEKEWRFHPVRKWRFDFAYPQEKLAIEIEGGIWVRGRHTRGTGYQADCEKYSECAILGWRVLRFTPQMVKNGMAIEMLTRALRVNG